MIAALEAFPNPGGGRALPIQRLHPITIANVRAGNEVGASILDDMVLRIENRAFRRNAALQRVVYGHRQPVLRILARFERRIRLHSVVSTDTTEASHNLEIESFLENAAITEGEGLDFRMNRQIGIVFMDDVPLEFVETAQYVLIETAPVKE